MNFVQKVYPDLNTKIFQRGIYKTYKKSQYLLKSMITTIFPKYEIVEEYRNPELEMLELDYFIPELNLAFEYQVTLPK